MNQEDLSGHIIGAAIEVHKALGPGLLESAYELALEHELTLGGHRVERQKPVRLTIEIKATDQLIPLHEAQLLTYLKLTKKPLGLLINFNVRTLKDGIRRVANGL